MIVTVHFLQMMYSNLRKWWDTDPDTYSGFMYEYLCQFTHKQHDTYRHAKIFLRMITHRSRERNQQHVKLRYSKRQAGETSKFKIWSSYQRCPVLDRQRSSHGLPINEAEIHSNKLQQQHIDILDDHRLISWVKQRTCEIGMVLLGLIRGRKR